MWVEKVFRGRKFDQPARLDAQTYKRDFRLLPKKEEVDYCKLSDRVEKIIPREMDLPPLLKEFVMKETGNPDPKMKVFYKPAPHRYSRLANEGETPNVELVMGVGKPHPTAKSLYEGI